MLLNIRRGICHIRRTGVFVVPFGLEKAFVVPLRVSSLKRSTAGAFAVSFRILSRKKYDRGYLTIKFTSRRHSRQSSLSLLNIMKALVPRQSEKNSTRTHKTGSWYLLGVLFKFPASTPILFIWESMGRGVRGGCVSVEQ